MKPAQFDYERATSLAEACAALSRVGGDARILAGGQTLVPMMAMRLSRPSVLIDINDAVDLTGLEIDGETIVIRSATRQQQLLESELIAKHLPLLADALKFVGHVQTRNRGTIGGSIVHSDPSAEIGLVAVVSDASVRLHRNVGVRTVPVDEFILGPMQTDIAPDECLSDVRFGLWPKDGYGHAFEEVSIRRSDFAIVAAATQIVLGPDFRVCRIAIAVANCGPTPIRLRTIEAAFENETVTERFLHEALQLIDPELDPYDDIHASATLRRRIARHLVGRAILQANARARRSLKKREQ